MVSLVALIIWRLPVVVVSLFFLVFFALDGAFLTAALTKVPEGAWFTILLALILSSIFILWRFGKEQQWSAEGSGRLTPEDLFLQGAAASSGASSSSSLVLTAPFGGQTISHASGLGIFFDKVGGVTRHVPIVFVQFVRKFKARPAVIVFFHMRPLSRPTVPNEERFVISRVAGIPSCYRVTLRHGYMDDVLTPDLGRVLVEQLVLYITRARGGGEATAVEHTPEVRGELAVLRGAEEDQTIYIMGKEVMKVQRGGKVKGFFRFVVLEMFLWIRENSRTKLADLDIDADSLVEVGFVKKI